MRSLLYLLLIFSLAGCASTVSEPERVIGLARFMAMDNPEIVSCPRRLSVDESLRAMWLEGIVAPLSGAFDSAHEVLALLERIQEHSPSLRQGSTALKCSAPAKAAREVPDTLVLFVWPTWKITYQRWPPRLDHLRLELGAIAKVIPRGQVLEGKGPIALRTAVWETQCHRLAANGAYLPVGEWMANDQSRWRQALAEVREACSRQIAATFERDLTTLREYPSRER